MLELEQLHDPRRSRMMPPPGFQICLRHPVTFSFDVPTPKHPKLTILCTCANWHQNGFIRFENVHIKFAN